MDMNEVVGYLLGYGIPIGALVLVLLMIVVAMGFAISWYK